RGRRRNGRRRCHLKGSVNDLAHLLKAALYRLGATVGLTLGLAHALDEAADAGNQIDRERAQTPSCHYLSAFAKPLNSANTCSTVAGGSSFTPPRQKSDGLNFAPPCFFSPAATAAM